MVFNIQNGDSAPDPPKGGCGAGGTCSSGTCGNGLEKVYPTAAIRYGYMKNVGEFRYPSDEMRFGCGAEVIIQTNRGIEMGEMVSLTCDGCDKCVSRDQIKSYVDASGPEYFNFSNGKILRLATEEDRHDWEHIRAESLRKKKFCQERADNLKLPMKVLEAEHLFGGERIIFYFMSEGRVDFRTLVRGLAEEYQTRIEMRQVGARDEARLLADYETCGRECCCKNFLKTLKPVSMKMAKMQKATLDPAKVSGRCGRLKCCLRYEHTNYEELNRRLPGMGKRVWTEEGCGTVVARQILTQLLQIQTEDGGRLTVPLEALIDEAEARRRADAKAEAAAAAKAQAQAEKEASGRAKRETREGDGGDGKSRRSRRSRRRRRRGGARPGQGSDAGQGAWSSPSAGDQPSGQQSESKPGGDASRAKGGEGGGADGGGDAKPRKRKRGRRPPRGRGDRRSKPDGGDSTPPAS